MENNRWMLGKYFHGCLYLSENPNAIDLLEEFPHAINWEIVSDNPNAYRLWEANLDKIH